jgi:hypothetical protein
MIKVSDEQNSFYHWERALGIKRSEFNWDHLALEQVYDTLKKNIFLQPDLTTYKSRVRKLLKEVYKSHGPVLNWTPETVSQWMSMAVEGLDPQPVSHTILFYLYKNLGKQSVTPFDSFYRLGKKHYINVLMVGAAASPYFAKCGELFLFGNDFPSYRFISFDPQTISLQNDFLRHYNAIGKKFFPQLEIVQEGITLSNHEGDYLVKMINGYFDAKWADKLKNTIDLAILPTTIFGPGQVEEYVHFLSMLKTCLKSNGIFILHLDLFQDYLPEIGRLIQALGEIGMDPSFTPAIITGSQDLILYNYDHRKSLLLNIDIGSEPGTNQVILFFGIKSGKTFNPVSAAKLMNLFLQNYFQLLY